MIRRAFLTAVLAVAVVAGYSFAGSGRWPASSGGGGGGAVSSVSGTNGVTCSPTTGAVVCQSASAGTWEDQMFAFAQTLAPTINKKWTNDWLDGSAVTSPRGWTIGGASGSPSTALTNTIRGGVLLGDTTATANTGAIVFPYLAASAPFTLAIKTDVPWFVAGRAALVGTVTAQTQLRGVEMRTTSISGGAMWVGIDGATSTTKFVYNINNGGGTTRVATATNIVQTMTDFAVFFDGTTARFYTGSVVAGTLVEIANETTLTNAPTVAGMPAFAYFNNATAASVQTQSDALFWAGVQP